MHIYNHILLAIDFSTNLEKVIDTAKQLSLQNNAKLSVIYVFDHLPVTDAAYGPIPFDADFTQELLENAKSNLKQFGERHALPEDQLWLEMGSPKYEIVRVAEENQVDLIVLGSHGKHGIALLLGSTANGVLHHAKCDVLAVRLKA